MGSESEKESKEKEREARRRESEAKQKAQQEACERACEEKETKKKTEAEEKQRLAEEKRQRSAEEKRLAREEEERQKEEKRLVAEEKKARRAEAGAQVKALFQARIAEQKRVLEDRLKQSFDELRQKFAAKKKELHIKKEEAEREEMVHTEQFLSTLCERSGEDFRKGEKCLFYQTVIHERWPKLKKERLVRILRCRILGREVEEEILGFTFRITFKVEEVIRQDVSLERYRVGKVFQASIFLPTDKAVASVISASGLASNWFITSVPSVPS